MTSCNGQTSWWLSRVISPQRFLSTAHIVPPSVVMSLPSPLTSLISGYILTATLWRDSSWRHHMKDGTPFILFDSAPPSRRPSNLQSFGAMAPPKPYRFQTMFKRRSVWILIDRPLPTSCLRERFASVFRAGKSICASQTPSKTPCRNTPFLSRATCNY